MGKCGRDWQPASPSSWTHSLSAFPSLSCRGSEPFWGEQIIKVGPMNTCHSFHAPFHDSALALPFKRWALFPSNRVWPWSAFAQQNAVEATLCWFCALPREALQLLSLSLCFLCGPWRVGGHVGEPCFPRRLSGNTVLSLKSQTWSPLDSKMAGADTPGYFWLLSGLDLLP